MGGDDVAVPVQKGIGGSNGGLERTVEVRVKLAGAREEFRHLAKIAGHFGPHVRRLGEPAASVDRPCTEVSCSEESRHGADAISSSQVPTSNVFKESGHLIVGFVGRVGQVPGPAFWLILRNGRYSSVGAATLGDGRVLHDR
jgi:hypothetical protein